MHRTIRILLALVMLTLVIAPNPVHPTTTSKGPGTIGVPSHAALFTLPAKPRPLLLRPDDEVRHLAAKATLPCGRFVVAGASARHRVIMAKPALLCWRTHLPRSHPGERPGIGSPPLTPLV
jgi:hypothetical protein